VDACSGQGLVAEPGAAHEVRAAEIDFDDYDRVLRDKSDGELRAANLVLRTIQSGWMMRAGTSLAKLGLALRVPGTAAAIERTVFRQFCGGTSLAAALEAAGRLHGRGVRTILDYAVESERSEAGFEAAREELERALVEGAKGPEVAFCAMKLTGFAREPLLADESEGVDLSEAEQAELARAGDRLAKVMHLAREVGASVFVDAEYSWVQPAIDRRVEELMREHNRERAVVHTTVQLYLRDRLEYLRELIDDARRGRYILGVKLVRGAYLEIEHERARARRSDSPVQPSKRATDEAFDAAVTLCLENLDILEICVATHNLDSVRHLMREMERLGIARGDRRVTASQLLGMLDRVTFPLAQAGYNALKYVPYGAVRSAFPYLLRRADENKSIADQTAGELAAVRRELRRRGRAAL
jgi:proline dehydrogenase